MKYGNWYWMGTWYVPYILRPLLGLRYRLAGIVAWSDPLELYMHGVYAGFVPALGIEHACARLERAHWPFGRLVRYTPLHVGHAEDVQLRLENPGVLPGLDRYAMPGKPDAFGNVA